MLTSDAQVRNHCAEPDAGLTHLAYFSRRRDRGM